MKKDIEDYLVDVKKKGYRCLRCHHNWVPRKKKNKKTRPNWCPKCHSPYWHKPKKSLSHMIS